MHLCAGSIPYALRDVMKCTPCQRQAVRIPPYKLFTCTHKCAMKYALCNVRTLYKTVLGPAARLTCHLRNMASAARS